MTKINNTKYKGRNITVRKFGKEYEAYVPFGNNTEMAKTKKVAIENVKKNIDERENLQSKKKETAKNLRFKDKKIFYYKRVKENVNRGGSGINVTTDIYEHNSEGMKKVGEVKYNTSWMKGDDSEVMSQLIRENKLPKELETKEGASGYYTSSVTEDYNFEIRRLP